MDKDRQKLLTYLKTQKLMSLTSKGRKNLWSCSVYYVVDDKFNFYFISEPTTEHIKNISVNSQVACNIVNSSQPVTTKKMGVQIRGRVMQETNHVKIQTILAMWNQVNPGFSDIINLKNIVHKVINSKVYKIKPELIKFFNEELYGSEGFKKFKF